MIRVYKRFRLHLFNQKFRRDIENYFATSGDDFSSYEVERLATAAVKKSDKWRNK